MHFLAKKYKLSFPQGRWTMGVWRTDSCNLELCPALFRNTLKLVSAGVGLAEIAL